MTTPTYAVGSVDNKEAFDEVSIGDTVCFEADDDEDPFIVIDCSYDIANSLWLLILRKVEDGHKTDNGD